MRVNKLCRLGIGGLCWLLSASNEKFKAYLQGLAVIEYNGYKNKWATKNAIRWKDTDKADQFVT